MSRKSIAASNPLFQAHSSILSFVQAIMRPRSRCVLFVSCPNQAAIFHIGREDLNIAGPILEMLRDEGVVVHLGARLVAVQGRSGDNVTCNCARPWASRRLMVAISWSPWRTPNAAGIGLELAGVALDLNI